MDVVTARDVEPVSEDAGTVTAWMLVPKDAPVTTASAGTRLEYIAEFEVAPGAKMAPHLHDSYEFYYLLSGRAIMQIDAGTRELAIGDLVQIPKGVGHTIWPAEDSGEPIRVLAFAASFEPPGTPVTLVELPT